MTNKNNPFHAQGESDPEVVNFSEHSELIHEGKIDDAFTCHAAVPTLEATIDDVTEQTEVKNTEKMELENEEEPKKKAKTKKQSRRRKKGGEAAGSSSTNANKAAAAEVVDELTCSTCSFQFKSRNQLFKHIKKTGHAKLK